MATILRVTSLLFGIFFLMISVPMMLGGAAVLAVPAALADDQGYINSPVYHIESDQSYAFVTESFVMNNQQDSQYKYNDENSFRYEFDNYEKIVNLRVKADSYFLGLASTSDVQHYLGNVSYSVVSELNNHAIQTYSVNTDKNGSLMSSPADQKFWLASGVDALYYTPSKSDFNKELTFVVMKVDGSQGVSTDIQIGVDVPILMPIGIILLLVGVMFFVVTIILFVVAVKSKDRPREVSYYAVQSPQVVSKVPSDSYYATGSDQLKASSASKFCVNCGTRTDIESNFCESCGYAYKKE